MFRNPTTDLIVVLVIVLLIFGPKRLPSLGRQLGQGMREFKDSITGDSKNDDDSERPEPAQISANASASFPSVSTPNEAPAVENRPATAPADRSSAEVGPKPSA